MKICVVGAHKTGTSSLVVMLEKLTKTTWDKTPMAMWNNPEAAFAWVRETNQTIIRDSPFNFFDHYKRLDEEYPDAKFILTLRPSLSWYQSVMRWQKCFPYTRRIYNHLYGWSHSSKTDVISKYETRNKEIIKYFETRPGKLLVINLWESANPGELATFLGLKPQKELVYPHVNANKKK